MAGGTAALDEVIRTLSAELSKDKSDIDMGKTDAEKEVLKRNAVKGKRRAFMGSVVGGAFMGGLWKLSKNRRKSLGLFGMMSGALFGASYGIITIRRDLLSELLVLPAEKSPFAAHSREILQANIPHNTFVKDLLEKIRQSPDFKDSWSQEIPAPGSFSSPSSSSPQTSNPSLPPRQFEKEVRGSVPPIVGLDMPRDEPADAIGEANDSQHQSAPFFLGAKPPADDSAAGGRDLPPLSHDPYERYSQDYQRPRGGADRKTPSPPRHDEDDYFFDAPSDSDAPSKPTTWEEIRRRANAQQGRK